MKWKPWTLFTVAVAGWMSRQQQEVIAYLREENKILREKLGRKRILLSIEQKRRLATKGKILGRKQLAEIGCNFTPDTILRWPRGSKTHRNLFWVLPRCRKSIFRADLDANSRFCYHRRYNGRGSSPL